MTKILAFSGSCRNASLNARLVQFASKLAEEAGADVTTVSLSDYAMPIYNGDLEDESGVPKNAARLRELLVSHDGIMLSCPEYNGSITPLLKNTIDWTSRPDGDVAGLVGYRGKVAGLLSASPGGLGGLRGLVHVRAILSGIGVHVVPNQFALSNAHQAFDDDGEIKEESSVKLLKGVVDQLVETTAKLS